MECNQCSFSSCTGVQSPHRAGWEQAKREAAQEVDMEGGSKYKPGSWEQQALYKAANRIRAMEYKEPTNDVDTENS